MNSRKPPRAQRGRTNAELRHQLSIVAFGLFGTVILILVFFPQLRPGSEDPTIPPEEAPTTLLILAASSLTEALGEAVESYERVHPERNFELSFAASNTLRRQIERGAPADLFLSAAAAPLEALVQDSWVVRDQVYAMWTTELVVIAPLDRGEVNAEDQEQAMDPAAALTTAQRIAIGDKGVPVGDYARGALAGLGLTESMADRLIPLPNEVAVVQAVASGACDRGLAYATSVPKDRDPPRVASLGVFPFESHPPIVYFAAILANTPHAEDAMEFLLYLTEGDGGTILERAGFRAPVHSVDQP